MSFDETFIDINFGSFIHNLHEREPGRPRASRYTDPDSTYTWLNLKSLPSFMTKNIIHFIEQKCKYKNDSHWK